MVIDVSKNAYLLQVNSEPVLINIMINPQADRKEQKFKWLTESKL